MAAEVSCAKKWAQRCTTATLRKVFLNIRQLSRYHFLTHSYFRCPSVGSATGPDCVIVPGNHEAAYPHCCPRIHCATETNEVDYPDQLMMANYDATLNNDAATDYYDDMGFSNVFPLWRDFRADVGINDEEKPRLFSPK